MTVTINEKEYRLHFGCTSVEQFYQRCGVLSAKSVFNTKLYASVVYAGIYNEAERTDTDADIAFTDVYEWVETQLFDTEGKALLESFAEAFRKSQALQEFVRQAKEMVKAGEVVKKKRNGSTLKKSEPSPTEA